MARSGTRKNRSKGIVGRVYSPIGHVISATGNSVKEVSRYIGNVASRSIKGVKRLGNVWVNHTNMAIRNLTHKGGKRSKGSKRSKRTRKSRK